MAALPSTGSSLSLYVRATDRGDRSSVINAHIAISILDSEENLPQFTQGLYNFMVSEDASVDKVIGTVEASAPTGKRH